MLYAPCDVMTRYVSCSCARQHRPHLLVWLLYVLPHCLWPVYDVITRFCFVFFSFRAVDGTTLGGVSSSCWLRIGAQLCPSHLFSFSRPRSFLLVSWHFYYKLQFTSSTKYCAGVYTYTVVILLHLYIFYVHTYHQFCHARIFHCFSRLLCQH